MSRPHPVPNRIVLWLTTKGLTKLNNKETCHNWGKISWAFLWTIVIHWKQIYKYTRWNIHLISFDFSKHPKKYIGHFFFQKLSIFRTYKASSKCNCHLYYICIKLKQNKDLHQLVFHHIRERGESKLSEQYYKKK